MEKGSCLSDILTGIDSCLKGTRILRMTRAEEKAFDWAYGRHSNIPSCCIEFFVEEWSRRRMWEHEDDPYVRAVNVAHFNYVPCPTCLGRNKRAKLKLCVDECGGEHHRDFYPRTMVDNAH